VKLFHRKVKTPPEPQKPERVVPGNCAAIVFAPNEEPRVIYPEELRSENHAIEALAAVFWIRTATDRQIARLLDAIMRGMREAGYTEEPKFFEQYYRLQNFDITDAPMN
jgi:hypothetical protein